ncbi:Hypothetical_protein [Hexamita inflata]|uniref:Hypothetical_protein n=1 Tax=Hexamita inflata TaxID=28002 RepID=A0AA86P2W5_9EUKA|nr:Hypothetical protein HINF_LOCUS16867 [Hexamita inflata]CAI9975724.1 Hypothetical protein HINF_LOCUS63369 [Hexamita inflata]
MDSKADKKLQCTETFQSDLGASFDYPFYNLKESICCSALYKNGKSPAADHFVFSYICQNFVAHTALQDKFDIVTAKMKSICGKWEILRLKQYVIINHLYILQLLIKEQINAYILHSKLRQC